MNIYVGNLSYEITEDDLWLAFEQFGAVEELYLKVVFKGKGGVSTGRLLAAVNRPH